MINRACLVDEAIHGRLQFLEHDDQVLGVVHLLQNSRMHGRVELWLMHAGNCQDHPGLSDSLQEPASRL